MKKIFVIAENVMTIVYAEETAETQVCYSFGAWSDEVSAQKQCKKLSKQDNADYFVLAIDLKN